MDSISFEWDENKNKINIKKHGVNFSKILSIFNDPYKNVTPNPCEYEERWDVISMVNRLLFVVYTERKGNTIRITSARRANKEEAVYVHNKNNKRGG